MTKEKIFELICDWEENIQESFTDYYSGNIPTQEWAEFLMREGFVVFGHELLKKLGGTKFIRLHERFEIKPTYDKNGDYVHKRWEFNIKLIAKYISEEEETMETFNKFMDAH